MNVNILKLQRRVVGIRVKVFFQKKTWCDKKLAKELTRDNRATSSK